MKGEETTIIIVIITGMEIMEAVITGMITVEGEENKNSIRIVTIIWKIIWATKEEITKTITLFIFSKKILGITETAIIITILLVNIKATTLIRGNIKETIIYRTNIITIDKK